MNFPKVLLSLLGVAMCHGTVGSTNIAVSSSHNSATEVARGGDVLKHLSAGACVVNMHSDHIVHHIINNYLHLHAGAELGCSTVWCVGW